MNKKLHNGEFQVIGTVKSEQEFSVELEPRFAAGLTGLEDFTHVTVLWYADQAPDWQDEMLTMRAPYRGAPEKMGVFATRSPFRPNGICASTAKVTGIDVARGKISLEWIDAADGTPVLDIKPYHPSEDRVVSAEVPAWCSTWPKSQEESGDFNWDEVFLF